MSKTANFQEIQTHINTDINACDALLQLLEDERTALKERNPSELEQIIEKKVSNLQQLEVSAKQRSAWVADSLTGSSTPEQAWLSLLKNTNPKLTEQWQTLKTKLKQCQDQNEVNGKVLARNQQVFKRIIGLMRGQSEPQHLYNQGGGRSSNNWQQNLGEA